MSALKWHGKTIKCAGVEMFWMCWICWLFSLIFCTDSWSYFLLFVALGALSPLSVSVFFIFAMHYCGLCLSLSMVFFLFVSFCHYRWLSIFLAPLVFLTWFWDKAVDWWWHDSVECTALSGSYPCCPRQSWQCCHGWMNTLFWHRGRQCQKQNSILFCQVL